MSLTIKYFGLVADITKKIEEQFPTEGAATLNSLKKKIEQQYPQLRHTTYSFAVNQSMAKEDIALNNQDEIALLPPFAGG